MTASPPSQFRALLYQLLFFLSVFETDLHVSANTKRVHFLGDGLLFRAEQYSITGCTQHAYSYVDQKVKHWQCEGAKRTFLFPDNQHLQYLQKCLSWDTQWVVIAPGLQLFEYDLVN